LQRSSYSFWWCVALMAACGSEDGEAGGSDAGNDAGSSSDAGSSDGGSSDAGVLAEPIDGAVGNFSIRIVQPVAATDTTPASDGHLSIAGKVYDGLPTPNLLWAEASRVGDCVLLKPKAPYCEGGCPSGSTCVDDDVCQRTPSPRDVGAVTLRGVTTKSGGSTAPLTNILGSYGPDVGVELAYPGFAEGAAISIDAAGAGAVRAFSVAAHGVKPLTVTSTRFKLDRSQPLALTWDEPGSDAGTRIRVHLDISHHGGARGLITCDAPDTGSLEVAASLVKGLLDLGVAGFPTVVVSRENIGTADIGAGSVTLTVYSDVEHAVEIDGLVSCASDDAQCPSGQTCQTDLTCK